MRFARPWRWPALAVGLFLYLAGLAFTVWGRVALGEMHNVSSVMGAELYADHRLIQLGPFRFVRHPVYLGWYLTCTGALLIYRTWTVLFVITHSPVFALRARREEEAPAGQFGAEWRDYTARVPAWLPRLDRNWLVSSGCWRRRRALRLP